MRKVWMLPAAISRVVFALALLVLLIPGRMLGQFGASMNGTVQDSTGAVVPGATVTLTNQANQQSRTVTSSSDGGFGFTELAPGTYKLTTTAPNFKSSTINDIAVAAESPRTENVTLSTGGATESVTVNASDTSVLQTSDASIGSSLSAETIQRLPTQGGDVYELLRTAPGITGDAARAGAGNAVYLPNGAGPGQSNSGIFQTENQVQISAAGQQVGANNYLIDGVSVNSLGQAGAAVVTPNQESVGQITVLSSSYSAEDGRNSGAQIKTVTKSGTNQLHGSAYFRYDEPGLNAYNRSPFVAGSSLESPPLRVNNKIRDYAASLGGPIIKDKLFLFASYEGFKVSNNGYVSQWVETPEYDAAALAARGGTTTGAILGSAGVTPRIISVLTPTCSNYISQKLPCQIAGAGIDVGSFGGAALNNQYYYQSNCTNATDPACVAGFATGTGGFQTGSGLDGVPDLEYVQLLTPSHSHANQFMGRADWFATQRDQLAASLFITKLDALGQSGAAGSRPGADVPQKPLNTAATFIYIHTFSPTILNELRANLTRFFDNQITDAGTSVDYGIPYINIQNLPVGGNINYGVAQGPATPGIFAENTYEVRDKLTKSFGSRTLSMGVEYRWEQDNNNLGGGSRPVYAFQGLFNFVNNAPIYEGITADPTTGGPANTARYLRSDTLGLFVQHDWKVTPNFTVNTGVRYEYFEPIRNKGQALNLPVLSGTSGAQLIDATLVPHNHFFNSDFTGVTPKFGFAWSPAVFEGKTVIRGGVARAMNRLNFSIFDPAVEDGPGFFNYGLCCGTNAGDYGTPLNGGKIQYTTGTSHSPFSFAPNPALKTPIVNNLPVGTQIEVYGSPATVKTPYAYLYSLEVQRQLPRNLVLTVGFQGSEAHHLPRLVNQNFLYATSSGTGTTAASTPFTSAYFAQTDSNSNYAGANVHVAKTFQHGWQLDATYTYSKSLDQISNGSGANSLANQTNPADNTTEWGPSDYDTRHRITASGLWTIAGTKGDNHIVNVLTNGWQINGIYTFHTGFPWTPVVNNLSSNPYVPTAATISPARPYAYLGGYVSSCSNSNYITGNDVKNTVFVSTVPTGGTYRPGIGRNSFSGPCYTDIDMSFAREQKFTPRDHPITLRFQANFFNTLNQLNLNPYTNGNAGGPALIVGDNPDSGGSSTRANSQFGKPVNADAGRQIEFYARVNF